MQTAPLTTTQASKILGISNRTVVKLFESGELKGYKVPGSKHRRFVKADVIAFAKFHQVPINED